METYPVPSIAPEERTLAALTHLSGLAGYLVPLGGVVVPIVILLVQSKSRIVSSVARQAILLNVCVFLAFAVSSILWITVILIPLVILFWCALGLAAIVLPIVGALKANDGTYFRYPIIGTLPRS
jgi:uncharacterized Tic20 family protein